MRTADFFFGSLALILLLAFVPACETTSGGRKPRTTPAPAPTPDQAPPPDAAPLPGEPEPGPEPSPPNESGGKLLTSPVRAKVVEVREAGILEVKLEGRKQRVRLLGITAPHPPGRKEPEQPYGAEAKAWVEEQILGRHVHLQSLTNHRRDKRDRILAYVVVEGRDFNARLVRRGLAWGDASADHPRREEYRKLEREARKARRGMWGKQ